MISRLPTRVDKTEVLKTAISLNLERPLYPTFVVYLTTIGGRLSVFSLLIKINPRVSSSNILMDKFVMLKNVSETYSINYGWWDLNSVFLNCYTKIQQFFILSSTFVIFFVAGEGIEPPTSRLWALRATAATIPRYIFKNVSRKKVPQLIVFSRTLVVGLWIEDLTPLLPSVSQIYNNFLWLSRGYVKLFVGCFYLSVEIINIVILLKSSILFKNIF